MVEYQGLEPSTAFLQGMRGCPVRTPKTLELIAPLRAVS